MTMRDIQVAASHYTANGASGTYVDKARWNSFYEQIQLVRTLCTGDVLEVGSGTGLLKWFLNTQFGMEVTTVDFDASLHPDVCCDILALSEHFEDNSFEVSTAFQVLEHLPFEEVLPAISQLISVARKYVLISLPVYGRGLQVGLHLGKRHFCLCHRLPRWRRFRPTEQHYWEINAKGVGLRHIRKQMRSLGCDIVRDYLCPNNTYHRFFVLSVDG